ncbi:MAG TPA: TIGR03545 family protein [Gemmatimonadaceae bacterium]|nr:TIGR03545 family protein [Gemmatimonadaceae bacterium]
MPRRTGVIRWRGLIPLALILALIAVGYTVFSDPIARDTTSEAATKLLGTQVDVGALHILEQETALDIRAIAIADPFDPMRNLVEAGAIRIDLERDPLLQKKLVIRNLAISDVRVGTRRKTAARPVSGNGFAPAALRAVRDWRQQFDVPLLKLTPIDTIKAIALDPTQLTTVKRALELKTRADSVRDAVRASYEGLRLRETLDSATALVRRLEGESPRSLGIAGTRQAVSDVRRTIESIKSAKARVVALEQGARRGLDTLGAGVRAIDEARRADYAFARGLLALPKLDAPNFADAMLGTVTIDRFQQAMYWTELAQEYLPPGIRPRQAPGPTRLRRAGTTVQFVRPRTYPSFHLRRGAADFVLTEGGALLSGKYALSVANLTSAPALVGQPVTFALNRNGGESGVTLRAAGLLDHGNGRVRDSVQVVGGGIPLPSFNVPGVPFRLEPGRGQSSLTFVRRGEQFAGRWRVRAGDVEWRLDSARAQRANRLETIVHRVLAGLDDLEIEADVSGTMKAPKLAVRSNIDQAIAASLRNVIGEEVAKAEARVRAEVDRIARERSEPIKAQVLALRTDVESRITDAKTRLEEQQRLLDERMKALSGGILGLPKIPGVE